MVIGERFLLTGVVHEACDMGTYIFCDEKNFKWHPPSYAR